jgi:ABC-2 type transport system permease protein
MLPSILLSGFMFPFEGMPAAAQWIAQVLPLTHFNVIIRGVMLRGADLPEAWPQLAKLGGVPGRHAVGGRTALQEAPGLNP